MIIFQGTGYSALKFFEGAGKGTNIMAMYNENILTKDELREAFQEAAAKGQRNLLVLREVAGNELLIEVRTFTCAVAHPSDIVMTLRRLNQYANLGTDVELAGVYDLARNFDRQAARSGADQIKGTLPHETCAALAVYNEERALAKRQQEWDRSSFFKRLFSQRPR